jgi:glycosyltransferase involved in cell wall biosynthesis
MSVCTVIPAYNAEAFLHKAIDSVLKQTTPVDEIIVVDDGSKDGTCAVAASYGNRVRLMQQKNQGPAAARNLAVRSTACDYIAFLDADDAWHPQKIEKQLAVMASTPGAVFCYSGLMHSYADGRQVNHPAHPLETVRSELRFRNPWLVPSCFMISRAAFLEAGGFDTSLKGSEDWDFAIALLDLGAFCVVYEPLTIYQLSVSSLSANADWMFLETKKMLDRRLLLGFHGISRWAWRRRILSVGACTAGYNARGAKQYAKELRYMLYSIWLWPSPWWYPVRFKALASTLTHALR